MKQARVNGVSGASEVRVRQVKQGNLSFRYLVSSSARAALLLH